MFDSLRLRSQGGALIPALRIHALHDQPKTERAFADEARNEDRRRNRAGECGRQDQRETVHEITDPDDLHEDTEKPRQKAGTEDEVSENETFEAEEDETNAETVVIH